MATIANELATSGDAYGPAPNGSLGRVSAIERLNHIQLLEAESIHIIREVAAEFQRPVMLYSIGKDSSVMLRLAQKAFHPAPPPFPLRQKSST